MRANAQYSNSQKRSPKPVVDGDVPVGEVGEIVVRPREPHLLFAGYFNAPEETAQTWRNLWHHTGDLARAEPDGQYFFADRKKDYIRYKGRNISMTEVEAVVAKLKDLVLEPRRSRAVHL